ncbi:hypothetical protein ACOMHN_024474 [Nucella lapillus]
MCGTGHVQLNPGEGPDGGTNLAWNCVEVQDVLHSHSCVVGCVAGHDHDGSHTVDSAGIQHLVMSGVVETLPDLDCYATAFLLERTLEIQGKGVVPSLSMPLRYTLRNEGVLSLLKDSSLSAI